MRLRDTNVTVVAWVACTILDVSKRAFEFAHAADMKIGTRTENKSRAKKKKKKKNDRNHRQMQTLRSIAAMSRVRFARCRVSTIRTARLPDLKKPAPAANKQRNDFIETCLNSNSVTDTIDFILSSLVHLLPDTAEILLCVRCVVSISRTIEPIPTASLFARFVSPFDHFASLYLVQGWQ